MQHFIGDNEIFPQGTPHHRWAARRRNCPHLPRDAAQASKAAAQSSIRPPEHAPSRSTRGRPAHRTDNTLARLLIHLAPDQWRQVDDIICGSIATTTGTNKGRLNVRPRQVRAMLQAPTISTELLRRRGVPERTARAIAQATRHSISGLEHYLTNRPDLLDYLEAEAQEVAGTRKDWELRQGI